MKSRMLGLKEYLVIFFLLFATDSILVCSNDNRLWARASWIMMLLLLLYYVQKSGFRIKRQDMNVIFLCLCLILSMIKNDGILNINYYQRVTLILLALFTARNIEYDRFVECFLSIMRVIAIVSLVGFVFHSIIESSDLFPVIMTGNGKIPFKTLFFTNIRYGVPVNRNFGPFWEPGAYQIYLNWALFYELNRSNRINIVAVLLFAVTILTTKSSAGVIILGFVFICFYLKKEKKKTIKKTYYKMAIFIFVLAGILFIINNNHLMFMLFSKFSSLLTDHSTIHSGNVSAYTRIYSVFANLDIIRDYPLFGIGSDAIKQAVMDSHGLTSNTNSILAMAASYGVVAGALYFSLFLKAAKNQCGFLNRVVFLIMVISIYSTENLIVSVFSYLVLIYEAEGRKEIIVNYEHRRENYLSFGKNEKGQIQIAQYNSL